MKPQLEQLEPRESPASLTPAEVGAAYQFDHIPFALNGDGQTIAIVDAYSDPTLVGDVAVFDARFGLPAPPLLLAVQPPSLFARGELQDIQPSLTPADGDEYSQQQLWGMETALDVEWAHAMAPGANIVVLEVPDSGLYGMLSAVQLASILPPVSVVSLSWGMSESPAIPLLGLDDFLAMSDEHPVSIVAASGDAGSPSWPATNPNVLAVGGTILESDGRETQWPDSGGGLSTVENEPWYQLLEQQTGHRLTPDVSYNAGTPYAIYDGAFGWMDVEGTSAGAPQWSALVSIMNEARELTGKRPLDGGTQLLPLLYLLPDWFFHETGVGRGSPNAAALTLAAAML